MNLHIVDEVVEYCFLRIRRQFRCVEFTFSLFAWRVVSGSRTALGVFWNSPLGTPSTPASGHYVVDFTGHPSWPRSLEVLKLLKLTRVDSKVCVERCKIVLKTAVGRGENFVSANKTHARRMKLP